jgi:hypothetical protein
MAIIPDGTETPDCWLQAEKQNNDKRTRVLITGPMLFSDNT